MCETHLALARPLEKRPVPAMGLSRTGECRRPEKPQRDLEAPFATDANQLPITRAGGGSGESPLAHAQPTIFYSKHLLSAY
jgi:hypothetical protein